jgi:uncharacterized membrane protein
MNGETPSKTDLMYDITYDPDFVPPPSPAVNVKTTVLDGKTSYLMKNHATGSYYEPDELTVLIWNVTDGKRTVKEIVEEVQRQRPNVKEDDIIGVLLCFADADLLMSSLGSFKKKRFKVVSAFEMDYTLVDKSKDFLRSMHNRLQIVLKRPLLWATVLFIILGVLLFSGRFVAILSNKSNFQIMGSSVVGLFFYYFVALAPVIAIHEIAHGLALVHYGGETGEMGAGLFYFGPMFYIETTDTWTLKKRGHRLMVYLAGNITTLLIGSVITFIILFITFPQPAALILTMVAFYCFDMALFNFAPPFETDGYYVLSDSLNMPNLRHDSYGYVGSLIRRTFGAKNNPKDPEMTRRKKNIFLAYTMLSVGWIAYIVFQTALFLTYMSQDLAISLSKLFQTIWTSQALSAAAVLIVVLSVTYFGMQVLGYGSLFMAAAKKAMKKPLRMEAIHNRTLSVFAYLPPKASESLSNSLKLRMEKTARKFTQDFEIRHVGRSCIAVLRMGGANMAFTQIQQNLKRVEDQFRKAFDNLVLEHKDGLQKTIGINSPSKIRLTKLLEKVSAESASSGNSGTQVVVKAWKEKQKETILYLLNSAFGTVWTIEVQPADEYEIEKRIVPSMLMEDLTLTDLYGDVENFKKRVVYGYDSLAKLAEDNESGLKESIGQPQQYQLIGAFEPIRSRVTLIGRTEQLEKKLPAFAPYFIAETWSGYLDNMLSETCCTLGALNKVRIPRAEDIKEMSAGELAVLSNDLSRFAENRELVDACCQESETSLSWMNQSIRELREVTRPSGNFEVGLLEASFNVNAENLEALPSRMKDFRKRWKNVCKESERIQKHVEKEYENRKAEMNQKKRAMLNIYPVTIICSILLASIGIIAPSLTLRIGFLSIALVIQAFYWMAYYRRWQSFHTVSKYPSETFSRIHLLLLAWTEAIYAYATTGDILARS